jgi:hypothetical protein
LNQKVITMTMFTMKPREVRAAIISCMEVNLVPFVTSSPGLGKSSIIAQIANDFSLELIDLRLSQCAPEDLMGLPMKEGTGKAARASFVPFNTFPTEGDQIPKGKNGWILLLDEFNSGSKSVQAAAYKLVLDRMAGQAKLHENCFVVCAGNLATDRAIVNSLSTAMQSRLIHIEMVADHKDFMTHAIKAGFDHRILGFLEFQPNKLHSFKPDHNDRTFACPRTWEFASRLVKDRPMADVSLPLLAGTLSDGIAVELHTFMKEYDKLPSYGDILARPTTVTVPSESSTRYALVTMMVAKFEADTFDKVATYVQRMPSEFQVIYFRMLVQRHPDIRRQTKFKEISGHLTDFLNSNDDDTTITQAA